MADRDWSNAEELGDDVLSVAGSVADNVHAQGSGALSTEEFRLLEAIAARILPTTDTPGAAEAGAANYVNIALSGAYGSSLLRYRRGFGELQGYCTSRLGMAFESLGETQQDETLQALQAGKIGEVDDGAEFFALMRRHILEGVFCEPIYGGNRDLVGWSLVGFPGQQFGYPDAYINKVIDLPPIAVEGLPRRENA